jgi:hypothetical protein
MEARDWVLFELNEGVTRFQMLALPIADRRQWMLLDTRAARFPRCCQPPCCDTNV